MTEFTKINLTVATTHSGNHYIGFHVQRRCLFEIKNIMERKSNLVSVLVENVRDTQFDTKEWKFLWVRVSDETPFEFLLFLAAEMKARGLIPAPDEHP